jgi:hypothetical protein
MGGKNLSPPALDFRLFSRFHTQVVRSGKQHIEREMEGRRKLDGKEGGLTRGILQPPPKKEITL